MLIKNIELKKITIFDVVIIAAFLLGTMPLFSSLKNESTHATVAVFVDNRLYAKYPLVDNKKFVVEGAVGEVTIEIKDGAVKMVNSPCKKQICVHTGAIHSNFRQIVCAPGHISVRVENGKKEIEVFDAIAQ